MKYKKNYFIILLISIIFSFSIKIFLLDKFYSETDDRITPQQVLIYKNESLYTIANDKLSPTYNNRIKTKIREIQSKDNVYYDFIEKIASNILMRASPSKHSTYAPMQYLIFAGLITEDLNYNEIKFFSRLPSVIFSILYILITYFFVNRIFQKKDKFSLSAVFLLIVSLPLLYISLRSYNYAAGIFTTTTIFFLTYLEMIKKNFYLIKLSSDKIKIKNSFYLGLLFSFLTYLNYSAFYILPIFFIMCFLKHLKAKKIFSYINLNLFITGLFIIIFSSPLIIQIFIMNLHQYGVTGSTGGNSMEYHLDIEVKKNFIYVILFFIKNFYLTISRNLSFFTEDFFASQFIHSIIFLFVCVGIVISRRENYNLKIFSNFVIFFLVYYSILVYFEVLTLGPTKHSNFYTPLFSILFVISLRFIYNYLKPKYGKLYFNLFILSIFIIFTYSLKDFYKKYTDVFDEAYMINLINKYDAGFVSAHGSYSDQLCLMKKIDVLISNCPLKFHRYKSIKNINEINLKKIKTNDKSIIFVNDNENLKKYKNLLENENFKLVKSINRTKFDYTNYPLYISKYKPNLFEVYIFK